MDYMFGKKYSRSPAKKRVKKMPTMAVDRISELPDALIHHIMSFLQTEEMIRTCVLSKRWKLLWYSMPMLNFSNLIWPDQMFIIFLDNCLEHLKKSVNFTIDSVITSFRFSMHNYFRGIHAYLLDEWLAFVVENKVKEISLWIDVDSHYYYIPKILFDKAIHLTSLTLFGVELDTSYSFSFPSLKTLNMENVQHSKTSKEDGVVKFLLGSPSLEELNLCDYVFFKTNHDVQFRLQSSSLRFLKLRLVEDEYELKIQVDAINLESLKLQGLNMDDVNLSSCKKIRNLTVFHCAEYQPTLQTLIYNLPLLEHLTVRDYDSCLDHLKVSGQHLKSFKFKYFYDMVNAVTIESAPELAYFYYKGNANRNISIKSSNSLDGKITLSDPPINYDTMSYNTDWYTNMLNFLLNLDCSWNTLSLIVYTAKALILPEKFKRLCRSPLLNWKHLRVITYIDKPERVSELKDSLMWISPSLEILSITNDDEDDFFP
ncbi:hypothetical protein CsatB_028035 [Cannabis sativa]